MKKQLTRLKSLRIRPYSYGLIFIFLALLTGPSINAQSCFQGGAIYPTYTSLGSPLSGPFQPGEEVHFGLDISWEAISCNWLHGLVPTLGPGWQTSNIEGALTPPIEPQKFRWFGNGEIYYNNIFSNEFAPGDIMEPGWFSIGTTGIPNQVCGPNDFQFDPNCSCGLPMGCQSFTNWSFQLILKVKEEICDSPALQDCSISMKIFSDWETGSSPQEGCLDIPSLSSYFEAKCCDLTPLENLETKTCSGTTIEVEVDELVVDPSGSLSYTWEVLDAGTVDGAFDCLENCGTLLQQNLTNNSTDQQTVTYSIRVSNGQCNTEFRTISVAVDPLPVVELATAQDQICQGVDPEDILTIVPATGGILSGAIDSDGLFLPEEIGQQALTLSYTDPNTGCANNASTTVEVLAPSMEAPKFTELFYESYCTYQTYELCVDKVTAAKDYIWELENGEILSYNDDKSCSIVQWMAADVASSVCVTYLQENCLSKQICETSIFVHDTENCLVSIAEIDDQRLEVFPNPVDSKMQIQSQTQYEQILLFNALGEIVGKWDGKPRLSDQLEMSNFLPGVYFLTVDRSGVKKILVQ